MAGLECDPEESNSKILGEQVLETETALSVPINRNPTNESDQSHTSALKRAPTAADYIDMPIVKGPVVTPFKENEKIK